MNFLGVHDTGPFDISRTRRAAFVAVFTTVKRGERGALVTTKRAATKGMRKMATYLCIKHQFSHRNVTLHSSTDHIMHRHLANGGGFLGSRNMREIASQERTARIQKHVTSVLMTRRRSSYGRIACLHAPAGRAFGLPVSCFYTVNWGVARANGEFCKNRVLTQSPRSMDSRCSTNNRIQQ